MIREFIRFYKYTRSKNKTIPQSIIRSYHNFFAKYHEGKYFYSSFYYPQHKLIKHKEKMEYHREKRW